MSKPIRMSMQTRKNWLIDVAVFAGVESDCSRQDGTTCPQPCFCHALGTEVCSEATNRYHYGVAPSPGARWLGGVGRQE